MTAEIVLRAPAVTVVGGGTLYPGDLHAARALAPLAVAADSGADLLLAEGLVPDAVIGDFDSLSAEARATLSPQSLTHVHEQDSTDFEKVLARISADLIVGVGFTGGRMDHAVAVLHALLRFAHQPVVLLAEHEIVLLAPPRLTVTLAKGAIVSLFPLAPCTGRSEGLHWPIDGLHFVAGQQIGTSNRASGGPLTLEMDAPGAALFLPKTCLEPVTQALRSGAPEHVRWPVRA